MNELKCPKCGTTFQIDEQDYENVAKQIRDHEFEKELNIREKQFQKEKENSLKLIEMNLKKDFQEQLNQKTIEINALNLELKNNTEMTKTKTEKQFQEKLNHKDLEISELKKELSEKESENQIILNKIKSEKENEIDKLNLELKNTIELTKSQTEKLYQKELNNKNIEITELKNQLLRKETEAENELTKVVSEKEKQIDTLTNQLKLNQKEFTIKEKNMIDHYNSQLKNKEEQIAYYKDFKAKQSTKMIGESLEQHCSIEFNKLRPLFPNAYFEKDNDIKTGSKGDFIFRDYDEEHTEIVSIMFEMKNESDQTSTKHKNEDFLKELNKDRIEKNCEYAVLVSLLEIDNEYYNEGIVDMSHKYEKMYVIRPQFFIPIITLIRNLSQKSLIYKKELQTIRNQNIDISDFEENMNNFKNSFGRNYRLASEKFQKAITEIDRTIEHLQKTKDALLSSENNLRIANRKAEDLTIKKLTHNNETMSKMFEEVKKSTKSKLESIQ